MSKRIKRNSVDKNHFQMIEVEPITKAQIPVFESNSHLVLRGVAGTGKTFLSMYIALSDYHANEYDKIVIIRSAVATRDIGYLPGNEKEKAQVYESPYMAICSELYQRGDAYEILKKEGAIYFGLTSFIRGTTLDNAFIIVDECQNMTFHELDSVITRVGKNSRIVFSGDYRQADLKDSGIKEFFKILDSMASFETIEFGVNDIVRSGLVKEYLTTKLRIEDEGGIKPQGLLRK